MWRINVVDRSVIQRCDREAIHGNRAVVFRTFQEMLLVDYAKERTPGCLGYQGACGLMVAVSLGRIIRSKMGDAMRVVTTAMTTSVANSSGEMIPR